MKRFAVISFFVSLFFSAEMVSAYDYTADFALSLSETYNDNIFLRHTDRVDDFITYISPEIDLSIQSATSQLRLGYSTTFSYYKSHEELNVNGTAHHFMANGNFTLSDRLNLALADTFVKSSEIGDIRAIPDIGPVTRRAELQYHAPNGSISYRLTENLSYMLGILYSDTDYNTPGVVEVKTYSGNMGLNYKRSERTTISVTARYTKYDYMSGSDATQQDYLLGLRYRFSPTLTIGITGGTIITKIQDAGESNTIFSGIDLTKTFERGQATLSGRQTVLKGIQTGEPVRQRLVNFSLSKPMTEKLTLSLSASYSNYKSTVTNNIDTDETLFNAGLTYNFRPWANLVLSYSYVDSNDKINNTNDYYNNIILFTLKLSYSRRL